VEALRGDASPTQLDLSDRGLGDVGARLLALLVSGNAVLTKLDVSRNSIGGGYVKASEVEGDSKEAGAKVIYHGNEVTVIKGVDSDGDIKIEDLTGVRAIANMLEVNKVLTSLNLSGNEVGAEGAKALASALEVNAVLTSLNLYYNNIGPSGALAIAGALKVNKALASALRVNGVLTSLNLSYIEVGAEGAKALASALEVNAALTSLE